MIDKYDPKVLLGKAKDTKVIGIIFLVFGFAGVLCVCFLGFTPDSTGPIIAMLAAGLVGGAFIALFVSFTKRANRYNNYKAVIHKSCYGGKTIPVVELAKQIDVPQAQAEEEVQKLIDGGFLELIYINHRTNEVAMRLETSWQAAQINIKCVSCGANVAILPGKTVACPYCGTKLTAPM